MAKSQYVNGSQFSNFWRDTQVNKRFRQENPHKSNANKKA